MNDPTWISVLPPVLAIVLAIWTRQVYLSLGAGIWFAWTILRDWNPVAGLGASVEGAVTVLTDPGNARLMLFILVIGALIATIEASGGVRGFVSRLDQRQWVSTPRRASLVAYVVGLVIFIESTITVLVAGAIGRPLFDRHKVSREKLAYLIDSTSAPICVLIPLNAWGAYVLGILNELDVPSPIEAFVASIPLNFYAIAALLVAGVAAMFAWHIGPLRRAEQRTRGGEVLWARATPMVDPAVIDAPAETTIPHRARNMVIPVFVMVAMMPVAMLITGDGDIRAGSGSTSVLWSVLSALAIAWIMLLAQRAFTIDKLVRVGLRGAGGLINLALVMLLALALAAVTKELKTGPYIASIVKDSFSPMLLLPMIFAVSAVVGFCTGTSWGTFAIMLAIAVPAATDLELPLAPFIAAVLSGGVFGDHASPISDTTIISSMAAATDHIDHVRTQLPYALIAAAVATVAFAVVGAMM